jgi:Protein of unknown function (DUF2585)
MLDGFVPPLIVLATTAVLLVSRVTLRGNRRRLRRFDAVALLVLVLATGVLERLMGRPLTYRNGSVRLWSGDISSDQNSQQMADPYTFTHVTHGALFYGMTRLALPGASAGVRLLVTVALEGAWEAYENTTTVIERYRAVTISLGYYGDSVLNSMCDIAACVVGFWLTSRLPRGVTIGWIVAVELLLALWIRDNLTLNILMLVSPLDIIKRWQAGG